MQGLCRPRLLGFARRFAYRFSNVSYGGNRRTISLNFAGGTLATTLASWLRLNTLVSRRYTSPSVLYIYMCVCVYLAWFGIVSRLLLEIVIGFLRFSKMVKMN